MIAVRDVEASSRWYQELLGLVSNHGGPEYERLLGVGEEEISQSAGDPVLVPLRAPPPVPGEADEDGRVHQQPHRLHRLLAAQLGAQGGLGGQRVDDPAGGRLPLADQLVAEHGQVGVGSRRLERRQDQSGGPLLRRGEHPGRRREELLGPRRPARDLGPGTVQDRHRLVVPDDGHVDRRLEQGRLGAEQQLHGRDRDAGGRRDGADRGAGVAAGDEGLPGRAQDPPPGAPCLLHPHGRAVRTPGLSVVRRHAENY